MGDELTPDDVKHWDLSVIHQVFETAAKRRDSKHQLGEALANAQARTGDWHGESGDAFREELGKTRTDINAAGRESDRVFKAVQNAEMWVSGAKVALDDVEAAAENFGWTITPDWKISGGETDKTWIYDPVVLAAAQQELQEELDKAHQDALIADRDLATALRASVGDAELDEHGHEIGGQHPQTPSSEHPPRDVGSQERPGVTDVNDPGVKWQPGFDPNRWKQSWQNPMLADNPPGYNGPAGPERDAAWQNYLAHFPKNERGFLPNPDAVNDPGLKVVGNAATQLGTSYAWNGGNTRGPSKGDHGYDPTTGKIDPSDGAEIYRDYNRVGFDCSGLAEYAAAQARPGVDIGDWTGPQVGSPNLTTVPAGAPLRPGDFVYYGAGPAHHVGIYVAPGVIINAPQSGLPVELDHRPTTVGPDPTDGVIRARRLP